MVTKSKASAGSGMSTRAAGTPVKANEDAVRNFKVYVFNADGSKLQKAAYVGSGISTVIENLTLGYKKIAVLVNLGTEDKYPAPTSYSDLQSRNLSLADFSTDIATAGLPMSGYDDNFNFDTEETATITVSRLVARLALGTVTINEPKGNATGVSLTNIYVMKAKSIVKLIGDNYLTDATAAYWGGIIAPVSTVAQTYLGESFSTPLTIGTHTASKYFYIFPNEGDPNPTQLTLVSVVDGNTRYFPIQINDNKTGTGSNASNLFIQRNCTYTVNITLDNHDSGTTGPEDIPTKLTVEINVADWELDITQDVVWE